MGSPVLPPIRPTWRAVATTFVPEAAALDDAGWDGYYDLEIFSDNGAFGAAYPDSLWDLAAADLARRGRDAFIHIWQSKRVAAAAVTGTERGEP